MKKLVIRVIKHPLVSGSAILFIGTLIGNIFQFLFNLYMSRSLSIIDFGVLASLVSVITFPSLFISALTPSIVHFAGSYIAQDDIAKVKMLFSKIMKGVISLGISIVILFALFSSNIAQFFHITNNVLLITFVGIIIFASFLSSITTSFLQANLLFRYISLNNLILGLSKFVFALILVYAGMRVFGGLSAILLSIVIYIAISIYPLKYIFQTKQKGAIVATKAIVTYALPSLVSLISINSFITIDIILTKHYFTPEMAGLYAGLSLIGRIIFFFSSPIGTVMFPLIVHRYARHEPYISVFFMAFALVALASISLVVFYALFPTFTILFFLKRPEYLSLSPYLITYGILMTCYSLVSLLTNFYLSIKKTFIVYPLCLGAIIQVVGISLFHHTISQIIIISLSIVGILLVLLMSYFVYDVLQKNKNV